MRVKVRIRGWIRVKVRVRVRVRVMVRARMRVRVRVCGRSHDRGVMTVGIMIISAMVIMRARFQVSIADFRFCR